MKTTFFLFLAVVACAESRRGPLADRRPRVPLGGYGCVFRTPTPVSLDRLRVALNHSEIAVDDNDATLVAAFFDDESPAKSFCKDLPKRYQELTITEPITLESLKTRACCGFMCLGSCPYYTVTVHCRCRRGCSGIYTRTLPYDVARGTCEDPEARTIGQWCSNSFKLFYNQKFLFNAKSDALATVNDWRGSRTATVFLAC